MSGFLIYMIGQSIYIQITKEPISAKAKRLPCQKKVTTFESCYIPKDIAKAQKLIEAGVVKFDSSVEKSVYSPSTLFEYFPLEKANQIVNEELKKYIKNKQNIKNDFGFSYYIYENDPKNPGKKTKKSKLYGGYVVFTIKNSKGYVVYKVQIDFMDKKGADMPQSIKCAIKSIMTYNPNQNKGK